MKSVSASQRSRSPVFNADDGKGLGVYESYMSKVVVATKNISVPSYYVVVVSKLHCWTSSMDHLTAS